LKLSTHMLLQFLGFAAQGANLLTGSVPPKYQPLVALGISVLQGVTAWIAHNFNPDGSPASVAYIPKEKQ
jgi:hypothetical protein